MGSWSGNWKLASTKVTHQKLVGDFSLQPVAGVAGVYKVDVVQGPPVTPLAPAWKDCFLLERAGDPGPELPWPLPSPAVVTPGQIGAAESVLVAAFNKVWKSPSAFERLEGDVVVNPNANPVEKMAVVVFKANQAQPDGSDMLIAVWLQDLYGNAGPDGSATGVRR